MGWEDKYKANPADPSWAAKYAQQSSIPNVLDLPLAQNFREDIKAAWEGSLTGLMLRGKGPEVNPNPDAPWYRAIPAAILGVGVDIPAYAALGVPGRIAGAAVGSAAGPIGAAVGGLVGSGASAFGVHAAIRKGLIDSYQKGEVVGAQDFMERLIDATKEGAHSAAVGAVVGPAAAFGVTALLVKAGLAKGVATRIASGEPPAKIGLSPAEMAIAQEVTSKFSTKAVRFTGEVTGLTMMPPALEGHLPEPKDFFHAAGLVLGLKAAHVGAAKMMDVYKKTGKTPIEVVADSKSDPTIAEDLADFVGPPKPGRKDVMTYQEELFSIQGKLGELEKRETGTPDTVDPTGAPIKGEPPKELTPEEITERDTLREKVKTLESELEIAKARKTRETNEFDSLEKIYNDVKQKVLAAGRPEIEANAHGIAWRARYLGRASRHDRDPWEMYSSEERPLLDFETESAARQEAIKEAEVKAEAPDGSAKTGTVKDITPQEIPLEKLSLSEDVPQFKAGADKKGIVEPLGGEFTNIDVPAIQVWERLNGKLEIISGRHRFDLAKRSGRPTISSQIHREADGFDAKAATSLDAILNIRSGHGTVADYAKYFKASGISEGEAKHGGLLERAKGRAGFTIARDAGPETLAAHSAGLLTDDAALGIAQAAPGNAQAQAVGLKLLNEGKSILFATNMMRAVGVMSKEQGRPTEDMFGFDDAGMKEAEAMAQGASRAQRAIAEQISAVSGAVKRPEVARRMGVDVKDPEAIKAKIAELRQEQYKWDNWPLYPELVARLRELNQGPADDFNLTSETPSELRARDEEAKAAAKRKLEQEKTGGKPLTGDTPDLFNPQDTLFQSPEKRIFYSALEQQLQNAPIKSGDSKAWKDYLKSITTKGLAKEVEIEAVGLREFLDLQQGKITKDQVADFIKQNGVKVEEVTLGGKENLNLDSQYAIPEVLKLARENTGNASNAMVIALENDQAAYFALKKKFPELMSDEGWAEKVAQDVTGGVGSASEVKFANYQLPGGTNYREVLLTLPNQLSVQESRYKELQDLPLAHTPEQKAEYQKLGEEILLAREREKPFRSSHFDQPNILAHIRLNDRTDADGKRVLFVEELQSDWGQQGRDKGFAGTPEGAAKDNNMTLAEWNELSPEDRAFTLEESRNSSTLKIPAGPFVTKTEAWLTLSLKRVIKLAADEGYDRVAFINGEQSAMRYKEALMKAIDTAHINLRPDGKYDYTAKKGGSIVTGEIAVPKERVLAVFGKAGNQLIEAANEASGKEATIKSNDMTVGGEGMRKFYDAMVPNTAKDVLRKLGGGGIDDVNFGDRNRFTVEQLGPDWRVIDSDHGRSVATYQTEADAYEYIRKVESGFKKDGAAIADTQPGFDITPALKEKVSAGIPLFQETQGANRGKYTPSKNLITFLKNADESTGLHESGHAWLEEMKFDGMKASAPAQIKADWDILRKELGIPETGEISTESHEKFARSIEYYFATGKAPSVELQGVFAQFREWLINIYKDLRKLNVKLSPELTEVLDRMLATDEQIREAKELGVPRAYVEIAKAEKMRMILPGDQAKRVATEKFADEIPEGPGKAPDNIHINYKYVNAPDDFKRLAQKIADVYQDQIQQQRGGKDGVKSWADNNMETAKHIQDILDGGPDPRGLLSGRDPNAMSTDSYLRALNLLVVGAVKDSARLRDVMLEKDVNATVQEQLEYMASIERAAMLKSEFLGERAAAARAVNQLKDMTEGTGEIGRMLEVIGRGELYQSRTPAEDAAFLKTKLDEIMLNYNGKTPLDIAKLHKQINSLKGTFKLAKAVSKATKWDMVLEGWRSGMLSGPITPVTNVGSTGVFQVLRPMVDMLAAGIGAARGHKVGMGESDRASLMEGFAGLHAYLGATMDGLKIGYHHFKMDEMTMKTESFKTAIPDKYGGNIARIPLRLMGAGDAMLNTMYVRKELRQLSIRQAFDEGLHVNSREFFERVQTLIDKPTDAMKAEAETQATRMTFNAPLGDLGTRYQGMLERHPSIKFITPFVRTPINITKEVGRMSPFAPLVGEWRADMKTTGVKRDRAIAEAVLGSAIMAVTMAFAFSGNISGAGSPETKKKEGAKLGGWQPYSVLIDGVWYNYARLQPFGTLIGMAADAAEMSEYMTGEESDKIWKMLSVSFANALTNQTFLQGITNLVNAISDPGRYGSGFVRQFAASWVPNIIGQTTTLADPYQREVNSVLEAVKARIPGLRDDLNKKLDTLGDPIETKSRLGGISPITETKVSEDAIRKDMAKLGIAPAKAPKNLTVGVGLGKLGKVELTPEQKQIYTQVSGKMIQTIMGNTIKMAGPGWENINDRIKTKIYERVFASAHKMGAIAALPPNQRTSLIIDAVEQIQEEMRMP